MPGKRDDDALTPAEEIVVRVLAAAIVQELRAEADVCAADAEHAMTIAMSDTIEMPRHAAFRAERTIVSVRQTGECAP
jgi:hypothetical protein